MDVPSDRNRNYLMDYLLLHGSHFHPLHHATNRSLVLILFFEVRTLLIKFASDFSVKSSSLEVFEQLCFLTFHVKVQLGPHAFMAWGSFPFLYAPPPSPPPPS
jgi:hypothetical protein